jgi:hypothetical protein
MEVLNRIYFWVLKRNRKISVERISDSLYKVYLLRCEDYKGQMVEAERFLGYLRGKI